MTKSEEQTIYEQIEVRQGTLDQLGGSVIADIVIFTGFIHQSPHFVSGFIYKIQADDSNA